MVVTTMSWTAPAAVLTGDASDWDGVWMLVYAAADQRGRDAKPLTRS